MKILSQRPGFQFFNAGALLFLAAANGLSTAHALQLENDGEVNGLVISLDMSDPGAWTVDTVHLGTRQLEIDYDPEEQAAVITPTWSKQDVNSAETSYRNVDNSKLHIYQEIAPCDCMQSESRFEINLPSEHIDEGLMEFVFSLQAGARGDYLFNGRTFTMDDFAHSRGKYRKLTVKASDFNEPAQKQRAIERVNFIFHRNGSMVSAPIRIRYFSIDQNREKIVPPQQEAEVINPKSHYIFTYDTQDSITGFTPRLSEEDMDITRRPNESQTAMLLIPQWAAGQVPEGHSGKVTLVSMADKAGKEMILTMSEQDFIDHGKKRNQIEMIGLQLNRRGSEVTEPITLRSITVELPEESTKP